MTFDDAFEHLKLHEGGYVNDPNDPGGETKYGISKRTYPMEDIPALTEERARFLYKRDFWGPAGCDTVPDPIRFLLFDLAVNSGPTSAIKLLQRSVRETPDGILGPLTLQAVHSAPFWYVIMRLTAFRMKFQGGLKNWKHHGKGWNNRNAENLLLAADYHPR